MSWLPVTLTISLTVCTWTDLTSAHIHHTYLVGVVGGDSVQQLDCSLRGLQEGVRGRDNHQSCTLQSTVTLHDGAMEP